jgi:DNA-binding response OmpR family regulator
VEELPEAQVRIVYVEDDEKLGRLTAKYLESHGVQVTLVADPREAIGVVLRDRPDVVLLDLMLPGMSGFEVCRKLREHVDTPILMVTARGEEADRVLGLEGGADDYVAKPFSSRELLARVRAHARRARGRVGPEVPTLRVGDLVLDTGSERRPRRRSARADHVRVRSLARLRRTTRQGAHARTARGGGAR